MARFVYFQLHSCLTGYVGSCNNDSLLQLQHITISIAALSTVLRVLDRKHCKQSSSSAVAKKLVICTWWRAIASSVLRRRCSKYSTDWNACTLLSYRTTSGKQAWPPPALMKSTPASELCVCGRGRCRLRRRQICSLWSVTDCVGLCTPAVVAPSPACISSIWRAGRRTGRLSAAKRETAEWPTPAPHWCRRSSDWHKR